MGGACKVSWDINEVFDLYMLLVGVALLVLKMVRIKFNVTKQPLNSLIYTVILRKPC